MNIHFSLSLGIFEKNLLNELGYGLPLSASIESSNYYQYVPDQGFLHLEKFAADDSAVFLGESLIALRDESFHSDGSLADAKRLMRLAIQRLLGGKSLKSRDLWTVIPANAGVRGNDEKATGMMITRWKADGRRP